MCSRYCFSAYYVFTPLVLFPSPSFTFTHTTSLQGFRSLAEQQDVEFDIETDHMGREKAINLTAVGGGDPKPFARDNY